MSQAIEETSLFDELEGLVSEFVENCRDFPNNLKDCVLAEFFNSCLYDESPHRETFELYDEQIKDGLMAHVKVGFFLSRIARKRLYQLAGIKSFKEYCTKHLNKTSSYCVRLIKAAKTTLELMLAGFDRLPTNESQCRPLTNITDPQELATKWQEVLDRADKSKGIITATLINETVNGEPEHNEKKSLKIPASTYERLDRLSKKTGKPVSQLIDEVISKLEFEYESDNEPSQDDLIDCPNCEGTGESADGDCGLCGGDGLVSKADANWYKDFASLVNDNSQPGYFPASLDEIAGRIIPAT